MLNRNFFSYILTFLIGVILTTFLLFFSGIFANKNVSEEKSRGDHEDHEGQEHAAEQEENEVHLTQEQIQALDLKIGLAGEGTLNQTLLARGKIILHPDRLVHIIPKVSGVALEAFVNIGDSVEEHERLALLESREMAEIKATYLSALSKHRLAEAAMQREEKLYKEQISSTEEYLRAKNEFEVALIVVQLSAQKLQSFGLSEQEIEELANQKDANLRLYAIHSPLKGTVVMRHITVGEFIENTTPVYEVADLDLVWVEIGIYPKDLYEVKEGQTVNVILPTNNKSYPARLMFVSPIVADETITAKAVAVLDNKERLWRPGVFVKVEVDLGKKIVPMVVPVESIQNSEGKDFIFVVSPHGFEKRFVKVGEQDSENAQILSGLERGESYVINQTFLLKAELGKSSAQHEH